MNKSIVCVSPNTSTDRISIIRDFEIGGTYRTIHSFDQAGGSGSHAAGVIHQLGGRSTSIVMVGGGNGDRWRAAAGSAGFEYYAVPIAAGNRSSFVLVDEQLGKVAEVIDPGAEVSMEEARSLVESINHHLESASFLILSGSLPPGVPASLYRTTIERAREKGVQVLVDAHGEPLVEALKARPWLIKPNLDEFHQLMKVTATDLPTQVALLKQKVGVFAENILLSLAEEGALLATDSGIWHIHAPDVPVNLPNSEGINPVGCGDAMVGAVGYMWVNTHNLLDAARWGMAASHVNLGKYEVPCTPADEVQAMVEHVSVEQLA